MRNLNAHQQDVADALNDIREELGEKVTFRQGDVEFCIRKAVRGSTRWKTRDAMKGVHVIEHSTDWIVSVKSMTHAGVKYRPERGNIFATENGEVFRPMPFDGSDDVWRWVDRSGQNVMRIFTKERSV